MKATEYNFYEHTQIKNSKYIFRTVSKRKLSDIYHCHNFYEIILIIKGSVIKTVNETELCMNTGDCIILTPSDRHSFKFQSPDIELLGLSILCEEFSVVKNLFNISFEGQEKVITFSCLNRISELRRQINHCCKLSDDCEKRLLLSMILNIYRACEKDNQVNIPHLLSCAVEAMNNDENLKEGVNKLVQLSGYSYSHLYRLIKHYYSMTPHDFVVNLKLDTSYNKLIHSDISAEDIAESVGFRSLSHFNKIFTEKYGISPAKLKKKTNSIYF